jgi:hypothetical protein
LACNMIVRSIGFAVAAGLALCGTALAADTYRANLGPMPLDAASRANIQGRGEVTATLSGTSLTISGHFGGLTSPATEAHVHISPVIGVPGELLPINLTLTPGATGTLSGSAVLAGPQTTALQAGRLYIQLSSQNVPSGTLWGWLLPAHEDVGSDVPQQGAWFQPHVGTMPRWSSADAMERR